MQSARKEAEEKLSKQFRRCCFIWPNWYSEDLEKLENITPAQVDYIVFGFEISPTGIPYLQGYVEFPKLVTLKQAKETLDPNLGLKSKVSLSRAQRDAAANRAYCTKTGTKDPEWAEYLQNTGFIEIVHKFKTKGAGSSALVDNWMAEQQRVNAVF